MDFSSFISLLSKAQKIILIANNHNIKKHHIKQAKAEKHDIFVSFNKCKKIHLLKGKHHHIFVHRYSSSDQAFFGHPHKLRLKALPLLARKSIILLGGDNKPTKQGKSNTLYLPINNNLPALKGYPFTLLPDNGGASTGFYFIALLDHLKSTYKLNFQIILIGFSEDSKNHWQGHAWDYERQWIKSPKFKKIITESS